MDTTRAPSTMVASDIDLQEFREASCSQRIQLSSLGYKNDTVLTRRGEQSETLTGANLMSN